MREEQQSAADSIPPDCELIEVHIAELKQLFNSMDASPFRERDLDPDAEDLIVGWAREAPRGSTLALLVDLDRAPGLPDEPAALRDAVHEFFTHRAQATRSRLRQLLSIGPHQLGGRAVVSVAAVTLGDFVSSAMKGERLGELLEEGLSICGWVAMWRPLEVLLYGWWPIRTEADSRSTQRHAGADRVQGDCGAGSVAARSGRRCRLRKPPRRNCRSMLHRAEAAMRNRQEPSRCPSEGPSLRRLTAPRPSETRTPDRSSSDLLARKGLQAVRVLTLH